MKLALIVFFITLVTLVGIRNVLASIDMPASYNTSTNYYNTMFVGTATVGGGLLAAGGCSSVDVTITGAAVGMAVNATPTNDPGVGSIWRAWVQSANTVRLQVCEIILGTPGSVTYQIRVIP